MRDSAPSELAIRSALPTRSEPRHKTALLIDILLVIGSQIAVFLYTLAHAGEETGGIVAIIYTGLFTVLVVPAVEMFFVTWLGTTPGRAILGLSIRPKRAFALSHDDIAPIRLRFFARIIDAAMACVLFAGIFFVMAIVVDDLSAAWWKTSVLCFFLLPSVEAASTHAYGATPGKRRKGLCIVDAHYPNERLSLLRCGVRSYVVWFSFAIWWILPIFVWGWAFADPQRRGLHDLAAGTRAIDIRGDARSAQPDRRVVSAISTNTLMSSFDTRAVAVSTSFFNPRGPTTLTP